MSKSILVTGASGFIGRNICSVLAETHTLDMPSRRQLDLSDGERVIDYLRNGATDVVLHLANPNPSRNELDKASEMYESSMNVYRNLVKCSDMYEKMIYLGSGAEFDKSNPICLITEEDAFRSRPQDDYGRAKQDMNHLAENSSNIYNLRVFGCYGPTDHCRKFITHCIRSVLLNRDITIRADCFFDYLYVTDLVPWINWMIDSKPQHHSYNATSGTRVLLSEIATIVRSEMNSEVKIIILNDKFANEYTASNKRIVKESGISPGTSLVDGIRLMIAHETANFGPETEFDGE